MESVESVDAVEATEGMAVWEQVLPERFRCAKLV